eukprot:3323307-Prymnesium_polylepis.1
MRKATVAVLQVQHVQKADGTKNVPILGEADLHDMKATVQARVLPMRVSDDGNRCTYLVGYGEVLSLPAPMIAPLNPEPTREGGPNGLVIESTVLQGALDELVEANKDRIAHVPELKGVMMVPYRRADQTVLFDSRRAQLMLNEAMAQVKVTCTFCAQVWPALAMRQHIGYHILFTPELLPSNPCGFCGGDAAQCRSWLEKQGSSVNARTRCVLLGGVAGEGKLNYNHASAKNPSATTPCTNHLVECAFCKPEQNQQRPVFWSYNLRAHHEDPKEHLSHPLPLVARVSAAERQLVKCIGGDWKATIPESLRSVLKDAQAAGPRRLDISITA